MTFFDIKVSAQSDILARSTQDFRIISFNMWERGLVDGEEVKYELPHLGLFLQDTTSPVKILTALRHTARTDTDRFKKKCAHLLQAMGITSDEELIQATSKERGTDFYMGGRILRAEVAPNYRPIGDGTGQPITADTHPDYKLGSDQIWAEYTYLPKGARTVKVTNRVVWQHQRSASGIGHYSLLATWSR